MKFNGQVISLFLSTVALVAVNASSAGGPGYVGHNGYNYQQERQQGYYGQPGQEQGYYGQPGQETYEQQDKQQPESVIDNESEELLPLPEGWSEHFDPNSGHFYYHNSADGITTWDRPIPDPSDVQPLNENEMTENIDQEQLLEPQNDEAMNQQMNEEADYQSDEMHGQENPQIPSFAQNSREAQPDQRSPENTAPPGDGWEPKGQPLRQQIQLEPPISGDVQPDEMPQPEEWGGRDMEQQESNGNQGPGAPDALKQTEQVSAPAAQRPPQRPPQLSGWGLPNDQSSPQPIQQSTGGMNRNHGQGQQQNSWGVDKASGQEKAPEQPNVSGWGVPNVEDHQSYQDRSHQSPQMSAPVPENQNEGIPNPGERQAASPLGQVQESPPVRRLSPEMEDARRQQQQYSRDRQMGGARPPPRTQEPSHGQQPSPSGQPPPQNQRPPFGAGQPTNPNQPPVQRYNRQYQQYGGPQQYGQYSGQQQMYGQPPQQQGTGQVATSGVEDGTVAVKEALGKSWEGILGFSTRTRGAMEQARDQVVAGASVAGQSISEKSTSLWGQARSAFGGVFEKSEDSAQAPYSMSNSYSGRPPQGYSGAPQQSQQNQGYPPRYPGRYGTQPGQDPQQQKTGQDGSQQPPPQQQYPQRPQQQGGPRGQYGSQQPPQQQRPQQNPQQPGQGGSQQPPPQQQYPQRPQQQGGPRGQYGSQQPPQQQHPQGPQQPQQQGGPRGQIGGPRMQPRGDAPYPHQTQQGQARGPYQAQYGTPGRPNGGNPPPRPGPQGQQGPPSPQRPYDPKQRMVPQKQSQPQPHPDPWSHPGISSDM